MISSHLLESAIKTKLKDNPFFHNVEYHTSLTSTSDRVKELAQSGAKEGTIVLAGTQTAGRGRMGRHFYSPKGSGMYMSLLLRPNKTRNAPGLLTACGAIAAWKAIYQLTGTKVDIKWVNDLYFQNKKLCGILAEGQFDCNGALSYVILGIGINVTRPNGGYAPEIDDKTIALNEIKQSSGIDYVSLCTSVISEFGRLYHDLPKTDFLSIYREQSCVLHQNITYEREGKQCCAKAISIDDCARLVVKTDDGRIETLESGEISLVRTVL